jgi:hypothetical protein
VNPVLRVKIIGNVIMYVDVRDYTHSGSHSSTAVTGSQVIPKVLFTLGVPAYIERLLDLQSCLKTLIIKIRFAQRISADLLINRMQFLTQKFR